ncbi:LysR family transcriptional regulator [Rhodococcus sp. 15-725-2-2b]|uniref:RidA family protein n=1 Tax=unclassified Rhodococcus (in: high G+C Gram-positive bacteria) TaxID=192944 RepID=UPI000B9BD663|nr:MULTISPECIES: RidA family protein [unclassified Rhodococcus (in: high G+C Gram-positive bacteria)]OZC72555.1 LysR family transcriptional regulator [Rhodococcus sp. 06-469-3-2]OZD48781.1 LysR family transcriptional regulator [Rhodococcus sp. 06-1477-1A]OZE77564.1 LysR family transcriptional regulator [Rhodococcus sp. 15-725-2-2b]
MNSIRTRLAELGLSLPSAVPPLAAYTPVVIDGTHLYVSGQVPMVDGALPATGKVGDAQGLVSPADARRYAGICALNALAAVQNAVDSLDRITQVVKVVGFVASDPSFTAQADVINGASELLADLFGDRGVHARSAVGVAVLPFDAPVEVEMILTFE